MPRIYKTVAGPSANKAVSPAAETKAPAAPPKESRKTGEKKESGGS